MGSFKSILTKNFFNNTDTTKYSVCKITGINPTKENKGSLYIFNNEAHVTLSTKENRKKFFLNLLKNGVCNGIPQEIGGIEDRTITSFVIDLREINNLESFIADMTIDLTDVANTNENGLNSRYYEMAKHICTILKNFKSSYKDEVFKDFNLIYFDVYFQGLCDGYLSIVRNKNIMFDFVKMTGFSTGEDLKVAGGTINGTNGGYIKPAPFTLGPVIFNPIGNDSIDINSDGMIINYIGLLRADPTNFKEFRLYLTVKFKPDTSDGKFVGRSQEAYDNFVDFIANTYNQSKDGKDLNYCNLPFILDYIKVEVQGDNPDNIKAIDIATIFYKAFVNLTIENIEAVAGDSDSFIDPSSFNIESDNICSVSFKADNNVRLEPLFTDTTLK